MTTSCTLALMRKSCFFLWTANMSPAMTQNMSQNICLPVVKRLLSQANSFPYSDENLAAENQPVHSLLVSDCGCAMILTVRLTRTLIHSNRNHSHCFQLLLGQPCATSVSSDHPIALIQPPIGFHTETPPRIPRAVLHGSAARGALTLPLSLLPGGATNPAAARTLLL